MKPALIALTISTILVVAGWLAYSKVTEQHAAKMGIQAPASQK